ncbi:MAG: laminin subunit alpha [Chlorobi bacterium]|nr:laminin subunit alpha [Chlorobiota bacterium]
MIAAIFSAGHLRPYNLITPLLLLLACSLHAQQPSLDADGAGRTYVISFPDTTRNILDSRFPNTRVNGGFTLLLYSTAPGNDVKIFARGAAPAILPLPSGKFVTYDLKPSSVVTVSNVVQQGAVRLEAKAPIIVYCYAHTSQGLEAWTPIPVECWGTRYHVAALPGTTVNDIGLASPVVIPYYAKAAPAEAVIIAAYDSTTVTINNHGRRLEGNPGLTVILQRNEIYQVQSFVSIDDTVSAQVDPAGISIVADRPVGVISGNTRTPARQVDEGLANNIYRNMIAEWLAPTEQHGTEFLYMPTWDGHRSGIGSPAEREGEFVRVYGTSRSIIVTLQPNGAPPGGAVPLDSLREFFIRASAATYFRTDAPAQVMMHSSSIVHADASFPCNHGVNCLSYSGWAPYMVELTPREQWTGFAPFYAPHEPVTMLHYINVVTDTAHAGDILIDGKNPFPFTRRVDGTGLVWGSLELTAGQGHYLTGTRGATFSGYVYGLMAGNEYYRPGTTGRAELEEYNALSYGYPLAPRRNVLARADSLRIDSVSLCSDLLIRVRSLNSAPAGLRSIRMDDDSSSNARLLQIAPADPIDMVGRSQAQTRIVPIDPLADASAKVTITDRTGARHVVYYRYRAEHLEHAVDSVDFRDLPAKTFADTTILFVNNLPGDAGVAAANVGNSSSGFSVAGSEPPLPATLKPGDTLRVHLQFNGAAQEGAYGDSLILALNCIRIVIPIRARVVAPVIATGDVDFGTVLVGRGTRTGKIDICNTGGAPLTFANPKPGGDAIQWDSSGFFIPRSSIDSLGKSRLLPGDCFTLWISFTPVAAGTYRTVARVWAGTRNIKDTSVWKIDVVDSSRTEVEGDIAGYALAAIEPNPSNGSIAIHYSLGAAGPLRITIHDAAGGLVSMLTNGRREAGPGMVTWNARNLPGGLYFCRASSGNWARTTTVVIKR